MTQKKKGIIDFLEKNISDTILFKIAERNYDTAGVKKTADFREVVARLFEDERSGFIHEANMKSITNSYVSIAGGGGTVDDPITFRMNIPIQEWLKITWEAILKSYGYNGVLVYSTASK